jgi:putative transposase
MTIADRDQPVRVLIRDRDNKVTHAFDEVFRTEDIRVIRTPVRAPRAKAHAERWVGSLRRECLDRMLIVGGRQLEQVVRTYIRHHNEPSAPLARAACAARQAPATHATPAKQHRSPRPPRRA